MDRTVPIGTSFFGCGTVTMPGRVGWEKWWCDPLMRASTHPAASSLEMISLDVIDPAYNLKVVWAKGPARADRKSAAFIVGGHHDG